MKKIIGMLVALMLMMSMTGCALFNGSGDGYDEASLRRDGIISAAAWVYADEPSTNDIATAKEVVAFIKVVSGNITTNATVKDTLYPYIDEYINKNVEPKEQVIAKLGALWVLDSVDNKIKSNPDWISDADKVKTAVNAYCDGFIAGLDLIPTPTITTCSCTATRAQIKNE